MSDRRNFFYRQLLTEDELDAGFEALEAADRKILSDLGLFGVATGQVVSQHAGTPNLTVDVTTGASYDQLGRRTANASGQVVDVSVDSSSVSTAVAGGGNQKWVSVFARFTQTLSDPRVDGNTNTVYFVITEAITFFKVQGAEAAIGAATRPALQSNGVLLCDIDRRNAQTQILNANIFTNRREAISLVSHLADTSAAHVASAISNTPAGTIAATDVQAAIDELANEKLSLSGGTMTGGLSTPSNIVFTSNGVLQTAPDGGASFFGSSIVNGPFVPNNVGTDVGFFAISRAPAVTGSATLFDNVGDLKYDTYPVGTIVGNITLTFDATVKPTIAIIGTNCNKRVRVNRMRTADAFTVTVKRSGGTTLGVIDASAAGYIDFDYSFVANDWIVSGFGGTVSSLLTSSL